MGDLQPFLLRDFSKGRISKNVVSDLLVPENSVSDSINVNFDEIIGSAKVRFGTQRLGDTVAGGKTPLGLAPFVGPGGTPKLLLAVFNGSTDATLYYYDTSWHSSNLTLANDVKNRFSVLGGSAFQTNSTDGMHDSPDGATWGTTNSIPAGDVQPSLVFRYKQRLLCAGDPSLPDRVFFSSIVDPTTSPFITWDTDPADGDWIDINPDDGGYITAFSESSTFCIVLKNTGMYRMDTVTKSVDTENIFNVGSVSQEATTLCQGVTYFFSGQDIRRTNGGYPEQISRLGVQDFMNAIPLANWNDVASGNDGLNVYFFLGDITLRPNQTDERTYANVVVKWSTRDETWSAHSYADVIGFFAPFVVSTT